MWKSLIYLCNWPAFDMIWYKLCGKSWVIYMHSSNKTISLVSFYLCGLSHAVYNVCACLLVCTTVKAWRVKIGKVLVCIVYAVKKDAPRDILAQSGFLDLKWTFCNRSWRDHSKSWDDSEDWRGLVSSELYVRAFDIFEADHIYAVKMTHSTRIERLHEKWR
jgi:hypothetical protein